MKIEIIRPESKLELLAGQVYKHHGGNLYLVVQVWEGYDLVNLNNYTRYAASPGVGMAGNGYAFEFVGRLKVTP